MKNILLTGIFIIQYFLTTGCNSDSNLKDLNENETFTSVFTKSQIEDIAKILDFFDKSICKGRFMESKVKCYENFNLKVIKTIREDNVVETDLPIQNQLEMYKCISDSVFNLFWIMSYKHAYNSKDTFNCVNLKSEGKYMDFLKGLAKEDTLVNHYVNRFKIVEDIVPMIWPMTYETNQFNFKDIRVRFFVAIHYLTLNDFRYRNEKYRRQIINDNVNK